MIEEEKSGSKDSGESEESSEDEAFSALSEREKFLVWLQEEKGLQFLLTAFLSLLISLEEGTSAEELFAHVGLEELYGVLPPALKLDPWKFWELIAREDNPLQVNRIHF